MNTLPSGEYPANAWDIYKKVCRKSYRDMSKWENQEREIAFVKMFTEKKYGFEYIFDQKIRYVGTNDLDFIVVE